MLSDSSILRKKDTLIIFTYAIAGFGHLRVTDALYHEVESCSNNIFLNTGSNVITLFHNTISIHPVARAIFEWAQNGKVEDAFTYLFRIFLKFESNKLLKRFITVLDHSKRPLKTVIVIATHFFLAHQISQIKKELEKRANIKLFLIVQVTDDSPQHIWYVPGADLTFSPSEYTKKRLLEYGKKAGFDAIKIKVAPYPVSETLTIKLIDKKYNYKLSQFDPNSDQPINIMIPISGAAVGLDYFTKLSEILSKQSKKINLHILLKKTPYTQIFINKLEKQESVTLKAYKKDTKIIDVYENQYKKFTFGYEITKPSEQAFKSLIGIENVGGPVLLFTSPVGRQEYDNLNFLRKHNLIPSIEDQKLIWNSYNRSLGVSTNLLKKASSWRGIRLFKDPKKSVSFFLWCLKNNIFREMGKYKLNLEMEDSYKKEVGSNGVSKFWEEVEEHIRSRDKT